jgi:hypothetical protein
MIGTVTKGTGRARCHPDRSHKARGMCQVCYGAFRTSNKGFVRVVKQIAKVECCHTDRSHEARGMCSPCYNVWRRLSTDPVVWFAKKREEKYKRSYGITTEQYDAMLAQQDYTCAICHKPCRSGRRLAVDHDHQTNRVRGLLCSFCNRLLGSYEANPTFFTKADDYLRGEGVDKWT